MPIFDGINLTITLDSGITEVDLINDVYEPWKDWMLLSPTNRKYPAAFRPDGGNALSSIINQGSYIFLNNSAGWRMKPPEEDITIYLTGNLAVEDTLLPAFIPTVGEFTAAILGLQPVTQGVTPAMASQLAFTTFQNSVCIDPTLGTSGTGTVGLDQIGTRRVPSNNTDDSKAIAIINGLHNYNIVADLDTDAQTPAAPNTDFSAGYAFVGDSPFIKFTVGTGANLTNCSIENLELSGEMDGINNIKACRIKDITAVSGKVTFSDFDGDIAINGKTLIEECFSDREAVTYPRITTIGTNILIIRHMHGSIGLADMTGGSHSIGVYGGRLVIEASCSGGSVYVRGDPYEITDLSGGAVTLIDQTDSQKLTEIWKIMGLDINNPMTVTPTSRDAGDISQTISGDGETTSTVTRDP